MTKIVLTNISLDDSEFHDFVYMVEKMIPTYRDQGYGPSKLVDVIKADPSYVHGHIGVHIKHTKSSIRV